MYTSTTVCSLCIVELQQRHSELVNGAITSNNMSYLTKTLSHCHWMCFMSNKKSFVRISCVFLRFPSKHLWKLQEASAALEENSIILPPGVSLATSAENLKCAPWMTLSRPFLYILLQIDLKSALFYSATVMWLWQKMNADLMFAVIEFQKSAIWFSCHYKNKRNISIW